VGSNPTLSAIFVHIDFGRARRGGSGALYPKTAIAGLTSHPRPAFFGACPTQVVLRAGSCATRLCEPRQDREVAAVSRYPRVPRERLVGAGYVGTVWGSLSKVGARPLHRQDGPAGPSFFDVEDKERPGANTT
jgi:hypothetical protein